MNYTWGNRGGRAARPGRGARGGTEPTPAIKGGRKNENIPIF